MPNSHRIDELIAYVLGPEPPSPGRNPTLVGIAGRAEGVLSQAGVTPTDLVAMEELLSREVAQFGGMAVLGLGAAAWSALQLEDVLWTMIGKGAKVLDFVLSKPAVFSSPYWPELVLANFAFGDIQSHFTMGEAAGAAMAHFVDVLEHGGDLADAVDAVLVAGEVLDVVDGISTLGVSLLAGWAIKEMVGSTFEGEIKALTSIRQRMLPVVRARIAARELIQRGGSSRALRHYLPMIPPGEWRI